jgi:hypothetical protein
VKEFISNDEFNRVLEILGLPGKTLEFTLGPRGDEVMAGYNSSWRMRATIGDQTGLPYAVRVIYVPVFLPHDQERYDELHCEKTDDTAVIAKTGGWCAPTADEIRGDEDAPEMTLGDVRVIPWGVSNEEYQRLVNAALDHVIEVTRPVRGGVGWIQEDNNEKEK